MFPALGKRFDQSILHFYMDPECQKSVRNGEQLDQNGDYYMKLDGKNYANMLNVNEEKQMEDHQ